MHALQEVCLIEKVAYLKVKRVDMRFLFQSGDASKPEVEVWDINKKNPGRLESVIFIFTGGEKSGKLEVFSRKSFAFSDETVRDLISYWGYVYGDYKNIVEGFLVINKYSWFPSGVIDTGEKAVEVFATLYLKPKRGWCSLLDDEFITLACEDAREDWFLSQIRRTTFEVVESAERLRRARKSS